MSNNSNFLLDGMEDFFKKYFPEFMRRFNREVRLFDDKSSKIEIKGDSFPGKEQGDIAKTKEALPIFVESGAFGKKPKDYIKTKDHVKGYGRIDGKAFVITEYFGGETMHVFFNQIDYAFLKYGDRIECNFDFGLDESMSVSIKDGIIQSASYEKEDYMERFFDGKHYSVSGFQLDILKGKEHTYLYYKEIEDNYPQTINMHNEDSGGLISNMPSNHSTEYIHLGGNKYSCVATNEETTFEEILEKRGIKVNSLINSVIENDIKSIIPPEVLKLFIKYYPQHSKTIGYNDEQENPIIVDISDSTVSQDDINMAPQAEQQPPKIKLEKVILEYFGNHLELLKKLLEDVSNNKSIKKIGNDNDLYYLLIEKTSDKLKDLFKDINDDSFKERIDNDNDLKCLLSDLFLKKTDYESDNYSTTIYSNKGYFDISVSKNSINYRYFCYNGENRKEYRIFDIPRNCDKPTYGSKTTDNTLFGNVAYFENGVLKRVDRIDTEKGTYESIVNEHKKDEVSWSCKVGSETDLEEKIKNSPIPNPIDTPLLKAAEGNIIDIIPPEILDIYRVYHPDIVKELENYGKNKTDRFQGTNDDGDEPGQPE